MKILPSDNSYKTFCDLTTGYRMFRVISEAVECGVIDLLESGGRSFGELLAATALQQEAGERFLTSLVALGLLEEYDGLLFLSRFSRSYLSRNSELSQRHVLAFEPVLLENWGGLGSILRKGQGALIRELPADELEQRRHLFQESMAEAAAVRARELWDAFNHWPSQGTIIDIGAGDGVYLNCFLQKYPEWNAIACDLPEVCQRMEARNLPEGVIMHPCNILDPEQMAGVVDEWRGKGDIVLLSNLCHCYGPEENRALLQQAGELLDMDGLMLLHDFFRDANPYGALYDLHMLVNTYNGRAYSTAESAALLRSAGFAHCPVTELPSGSLALAATRTLPFRSADSLFTLKEHAFSLGFYAVVIIDPACIRSEAWVRAKCAYGCAEYGKRWSCPPHSLDQAGFEELLAGYGRALFVAGQPPLREFQRHLLELEKGAFLGGYKKALVFSGGPCCWCDQCPSDRCAHPEKRRPSLESCGCDVFALAERCAIPISPLRHDDDFVQYFGLLLVD